MDYTKVLICNKTHGDLFGYKKALLRVYFEYIWFQQNKNDFDNVTVDFIIILKMKQTISEHNILNQCIKLYFIDNI